MTEEYKYFNDTSKRHLLLSSGMLVLCGDPDRDLARLDSAYKEDVLLVCSNYQGADRDLILENLKKAYETSKDMLWNKKAIQFSEEQKRRTEEIEYETKMHVMRMEYESKIGKTSSNKKSWFWFLIGWLIGN